MSTTQTLRLTTRSLQLFTGKSQPSEDSVNTGAGTRDGDDNTRDQASDIGDGLTLTPLINYAVNYTIELDLIENYRAIDNVQITLHHRRDYDITPGIYQISPTIDGQKVGIGYLGVGSSGFIDTVWQFPIDPVQQAPWTYERLKTMVVGFWLTSQGANVNEGLSAQVSEIGVIATVGDSLGFTTDSLVDKVAKQLRDTKVPELILGWLNETAIQIASEYELPFLFSTGSFYTQASKRDYYLPPSFYWAFSFVEEGKWPPLTPTTEELLAIADPLYLTTTGIPSHYTLHGRNLGLWRLPTGSSKINYYFQRRPLLLQSSTQATEFTPEWHELLVQGAKVRGYEYERNPLLDSAIKVYQMLLRAKAKNLYHRPDVQHTLGDSARGSRYGRPPYPVLPSTFPRMW